MRRIYLDHNATTPVDPQVVAAMLPYLTEIYGNASSIHSFGQQARAAVEQARESVARLIGARPAEIVFTSGGTEADNLAILGAVRASQDARKHVITSQIEHHAVLHACQALEAEGVELTYLPVSPNGVVDPVAVRSALKPHTVLISVMFANNELGTIQPVAEIAKIAAEAGVAFHTDAVQAAGKIPLDVSSLGVNLLSLSGHKIYAPKGVGALYVRTGTRLAPISFGGHHERDRRPGTENVPGIIALGRAAEVALERLASEPARIAALRDRFERELLARISDARINGAGARRVANTSNVTFQFVEGESLVIALDLKGVSCSTGAACSSGAIEPSHVLTAIELAPQDARASLRFSFGHANSEADVDAALDALESAVRHLREISPVAPRASR
jgi:cysteine desulfurase